MIITILVIAVVFCVLDLVRCEREVRRTQQTIHDLLQHAQEA
jgi:hypothetical protein